MFRGIAWLAKLIAAGLILSFLSIWTTGYIVTSYVDSLLKQFQLPLDVPPMAMSGVWGKLWGADPLLTSDIADSGANPAGDDQQAQGERQDEADEAVDAFGPIEDPPLTDIGMGKGTQAGSEAGTLGDSGVEEGATGIDGTEVAITTDDITLTKEQMSDEDKSQLFALLIDKLPQESWQEISEYVENGLTEQELTNIQQIMAMHLDKAEYEQIMEILKKY